MVKRMLIDATHPEETRVVVLDGTRLEEFDVETSTKKQIKGNIYLAKVVRVEPSLQAAFVDYGGNRHGFLAFSEIHPDYYQIPVADRERLMAEVERQEEEERAYERQERNRPPQTSDTPQNGDADAQTGHEAHDHAHHEEHHDHDHNHDHEHHHDDHHHDEHHHDEHGGEIPLAFIPPAITAELPPDDHDHDHEHHDHEHHDHEHTAEAAPAWTEVPTSSDTPSDETSVQPEPAPETVGGKSHGESAQHLDGDAAPAPSGETRPAPSSGVETVGGDEEEEEETNAADSRRRRFVAQRHYKIQEVIKRRQIMLVQVVKEERGNKGAALTTFLSLAGRYCVLMPNSARGGGVSRKITSAQDRRRLKTILGDLELPKNMAVILRTAGAERNKAEIKRDYEYLQRTWNAIREVTMSSRAPALVHEEASLIKRAIRDIYSRDIEEVWVDGEEGYKTAKDFMKTLTPSHAKKVQRYKDDIIPLFHRYQVETQMESINSPSVQLRSGGSIVFGQTEALVAIDVNSGRATKERHIEETAFKTNMEAAEEIARQLRLRDLAGLIVIDFIDMEDNRNNHAVERRLKEALKADRARIQVGRISHFGLLELSRQRLRPSLIEANFRPCSHCAGTGMVRSTESAAVHSLRMMEEEGVRRRSSEITVTVHPDVALYLLNYKREALASVEARYGLKIFVLGDPALVPPNVRLDRVKALREDGAEIPPPRIEPLPQIEHVAAEAEETEAEDETETSEEVPRDSQRGGHREGRDHQREGGRDGGREPHRDANRDGNRDEEGGGRKRRRRRRRGRRGGEPREDGHIPHGGQQPAPMSAEGGETVIGAPQEAGPEDQTQRHPQQGGEGGPPRDEHGRRRRRGRRGGRRRRREHGEPGSQPSGFDANGNPQVSEPGNESWSGHAAPGTLDGGNHAAQPAFEPAPHYEPAAAVASDDAAPSSSGPSRFFRAIKDNVPWRRADSGNDAPPAAAPEPASPSSPPAPAPATTEAASDTGPGRKGWWQNPTK